MKMRNSGLAWFLVCGIPALFLCFVGMAVSLLGWKWAIAKCVKWVKELSQ